MSNDPKAAAQGTPAAEAKKPDPTPVAELAKETVPSAPPAEQKPESTLLAGDPPKKEEGGKKEEPKVPEKYDLKMPKETLLDAKASERIAAAARERGLSNEQAQGVVDYAHEALGQYHQGQLEAFKAETAAWRDQAKSDKDMGGAKFDENVKLANAALDRFASDDLKVALRETGLGNHPELLRVFWKIGKAMSDDSFVRPGAPGAGKKSITEILYGSPEPVVSKS